MRRRSYDAKFLATFAVVGIALGSCAPAPTPITSCGTIGTSGSYALANNLLASGDCVVIDAPNVTLDLRGFEIKGAGSGIGVQDTGHGGITVRDGTVTGFQDGVSLNVHTGGANRIERIHALDNAGTGLRGGADSIVVGNIVRSNGKGGIAFRCPSLIMENVATGNGDGMGPADLTNIGGPLGESGCIFQYNIISTGPSPRNLLP